MANKKLKAEREAKLRAEAEKKARQKKMSKILAICAGVLAALLILTGITVAVINANKTYYADIVIKDYGTITLELDAKTAPITVGNFVKLAESGFYDGLTFHRIMKNFMMQGGDPEGTGMGGNVDKNGKKITIKGEFSENGVKNHISHERGVISMARGNSYDSASSQFFIVHQTSTHLDGKYAAFGHVISGIEIVDEICNKAKTTDEKIPKADQPVIETITIRTEYFK